MSNRTENLMSRLPVQVVASTELVGDINQNLAGLGYAT